MRHANKVENLTHTQDKAVETVPEEAQTLNLLCKDLNPLF